MSQEQTKTRILIVDDHSIVRHGLAALLAKQPDLQICGEAATFDEAVAALQSLRPDLMLVDITLKDRSGLDLIREAQARGLAIRSLVLSMHDEASYAEKALRAGAMGYVMKENADEVIVEAIRTVLRGQIYVSSAMSARMLTQFIKGEEETPSGTGFSSLTEREREIFECLGQGMTSRKIAEKYGLSARTVEVHRAHIKKKMQCEDSAQLLREAVRWVEQQEGKQ